MGCIPRSGAEAYVYVTCVFLGISMLMPLNAVMSAPWYMVHYYKYVTGDEWAEPNIPMFWRNILTFYNLISVPTQIIVGPTVLMPWARKLSLATRFILAHALMMLELFVILIMPVGQVSQNAAIVGFILVTIAAGAGKSYYEATCYAMVGTMDPKFMSAVMFGCGFSGVISSVLQCIIKASMSDSYQSTLQQSYIYFSLALGFMTLSLSLALSLRWNTYAQKYVGEYRMLRRAMDIAERRASGEVGEDGNEMPNTLTMTGGAAHLSAPFASPESETFGRIVLDDVTPADAANENRRSDSDEHGATTALPASRKEQKLAAGDASDDNVVRAVEALDDLENDAHHNMTTSEQLQATRVWPVVRMIYPVQIACFFIFFVSLFIFPSFIIPIDRTSKWFSTLAILTYNCGDATGRLSSSFKFLWPTRRVLLIVTFCRFAFIPLMFLCVFHYIPTHYVPCIFLAFLGLTKGFFGSVSMVFGPGTSGLKTDGQRVMAGQLMGLALLAGASAAALLAMLVIVLLHF